MKRFWLGVLFCIVMSTSAFAANPVVTLDKAVYTDDNTLVNLSAIAPYREVEFQYDISADTPAITYRYYVQTGNQNISGNGSLVGSISPLTVKAEFASMEVGKISLFVYDSNSGIGMSETQLQAIAGIPPVVHVTGIKLRDAGNPLEEPASHIEMTLQGALNGRKLEPVVEPENAANKKVKWSSSNEKVATVDSDGWVQGVASGDATITATTEDGGFKATCKVTVFRDGAAEIVIINPSEVYLQVGEKEVIHVPESGLAPYQTISWDIKVPEIASLSPRGFSCEVLALRAGETQITATTEGPDGEPISATCRVTVVSEDARPPRVPDQSASQHSGGGGCNAWLAGVLALALVPMVRRKRK